MYHIVANIDSRFASLDQALAAYNVNTPVDPYLPETSRDDEDKTTKRICVAETLENCCTGIGLLGRFRRCLDANEDAFSYVTRGLEVYPVLILRFADDLDYYKPSLKQVPDRYKTKEFWLLHSQKPESVELVWFHPWSITWRDSHHPDVAKTVTYHNQSDLPPSAVHPWLNGKGHMLESSEMETT